MAEQITTKTIEPLDIKRTMQEIKEYLEKPKWTDAILNEERRLFLSLIHI